MTTKLCPTCSTPIPAAAPGGFCPGCLLRDAAEPASTGQPAPSLEEVAAAFPTLEIISLIGQGGMGSVYKVRQPSLDRIVALKLLAPQLSRDPAFAERFTREARVLGKLNHPNIVTVYEHGESGGFYYLIMEYVDGVNLRQAMRAGRFTPEQALNIVPGICDALQAAHAQGIWHRDIKPENILLDQRGGVKIADFGIAKLVEDQTKNFTLTGTGNALGSIAYMAPEQHESPHTVDHRADIYSLGVVIYEMLTGELPLGRFPAPSQRAAVSARIDEIVFQSLEKERELRQQSAEEVKTDVTGAATAPVAAKAAGLSRAEENPLSWVLVIAAVLCTIVATWIGFSPGQTTIPSVAIGQGGGWLWESTWSDSSFGTIRYSRVIRFSSVFPWQLPSIAMLFATPLWLVWLKMKRRKGEALDSFLRTPAFSVWIRILGTWLTATAFCVWALVLSAALYAMLYKSLVETDQAPGGFLLPGYFIAVAAAFVWTCLRVARIPSVIVVKAAALTPSFSQSDHVNPRIQPTIILHAVLFALVAFIFVFVLPRFGEILREMGVPRSFIPRIRTFASVTGLLFFPVLFGIDVGLCFLVRKYGGRRGLQRWSMAVVLVMVSVVMMASGALYLPLKSVTDPFRSTGGAERELSFYEWGQGNWVLDAEETAKLNNNSPTASALHDFFAETSGNKGAGNKQLLTIARHQVIWTDDTWKLLTPIQQIGVGPSSSQLTLTFTDGNTSILVCLARRDEATLIVTPLETDAKTYVTSPRFTLVFKRSGSTTSESPQVTRTSTSESWTYTPRHMTSTEIENFLKSPVGKYSSIDKKRNFVWTEGMTTQFSNGKFTLAGPTEQVRPLMSWIRMLDITKIPPAGTRRGEIPPDFMAILAVAAMMVHDEFDEKMLGAAFYKTLQAEKISAVQLARSLRNHVWEFEKITVAGAPKENAGKSDALGATTTYEITIPCSDRMNDPLKLSFIEINLGFRKEEKFISLSPWLLEEAKQQSAERFVKKPEDLKGSAQLDRLPDSGETSGKWSASVVMLDAGSNAKDDFMIALIGRENDIAIWAEKLQASSKGKDFAEIEGKTYDLKAGRVFVVSQTRVKQTSTPFPMELDDKFISDTIRMNFQTAK